MKIEINKRLAARNIELIGEYTNAKTKTTFTNHVCGHTWLVAPDGVLQGTGCPQCKNRKLIHGVGDNDLRAASDSPVYIIWNSMLTRCYSDKFQARQPTYIGVTCCQEWHTFSNFFNWVTLQNWEGNQLDKDLLVPDNKEYGPNTCLFVPPQVNNLIRDARKRTKDLPKGVHFNGKGYFAEFNKKYLGSFISSEAAHTAYTKYRNIALETLAAQQQDIRIKTALLNRRKL